MTWKKLRYKSLIMILTVFLAIGLLLFLERSGIKYSKSSLPDPYITETDIVTAKEVQKELAPACLLITDSGSRQSMEAVEQFRQIFRDMKVGYEEIDIAKDKIPDYKEYETVTVLLCELSGMKESLLTLTEWVEEGGNAFFPLTIQKDPYSDLIERKLGIISADYDNTVVDSIYVDENFMLGGGKGYKMSDPFDSAWAVEVDENVTVYAYTGDKKKVPLIWENTYGKGKFVVDNFGIYEKVMRGFYAASYSLLTEVCVYPVIDASMFYLDDFPSPVPGGDGTYIREDYNMNISDFYTNVWWPDMLDMAKEHGVKYTGVLIETYEDDTSGEVERTGDTDRFQYFGNMLLHQGGEIGYHGYNHQPLCLDNVDYGKGLPYKTWKSYEGMETAVQEMEAFGKEMYPREDLSVYVPPSNILSQEGREMLSEFPEIRTVASTYFSGEFAYEQEFEVAKDGMVETPRIISGAIIDDYMKLAAMSELNMHMVNSHFIHPDDLLDEDRGATLGWEKLKSTLSDYMDWLYESVPSIRNMTGSEGAGAVQRYAALTVEKEISGKQMELTLDHFYDEAYLMVRMNNKTPGDVTGGELEHLTGNLFLLHATDRHVTIELKE